VNFIPNYTIKDGLLKDRVLLATGIRIIHKLCKPLILFRAQRIKTMMIALTVDMLVDV